MKRKPVEDIIHELRERVAGEYFAKNPLRVFPDDFLSDEVKKDLAKPIKYPDMFKFGPSSSKGLRRDRGKKNNKISASLKRRSMFKTFTTFPFKPIGYKRTDEEMQNTMDRLLPKLGRPKKKNKIDFEQIRRVSELSKMIDLITKAKYVEVLLPMREKLKLWAEGEFGICFENHRIFKEFSSLEEAKYLLYSRKKGQLMYKVPKDEAVVKRAVAEYEKYLSQMRAGLVKAFRRRKIPKEAAEELTTQVIKEKIAK